VGWERVYSKLLEIVVGHQKCFSTDMNLHPCEEKGMYGVSPYIRSKEI
jgi:hypothetical protein